MVSASHLFFFSLEFRYQQRHCISDNPTSKGGRKTKKKKGTRNQGRVERFTHTYRYARHNKTVLKDTRVLGKEGTIIRQIRTRHIRRNILSKRRQQRGNAIAFRVWVRRRRRRLWRSSRRRQGEERRHSAELLWRPGPEFDHFCDQEWPGARVPRGLQRAPQPGAAARRRLAGDPDAAERLRQRQRRGPARPARVARGPEGAAYRDGAREP